MSDMRGLIKKKNVVFLGYSEIGDCVALCFKSCLQSWNGTVQNNVLALLGELWQSWLWGHWPRPPRVPCDAVPCVQGKGTRGHQLPEGEAPSHTSTGASTDSRPRRYSQAASYAARRLKNFFFPLDPKQKYIIFKFAFPISATSRS